MSRTLAASAVFALALLSAIPASAIAHSHGASHELTSSEYLTGHTVDVPQAAASQTAPNGDSAELSSSDYLRPAARAAALPLVLATAVPNEGRSYENTSTEYLDRARADRAPAATAMQAATAPGVG